MSDKIKNAIFQKKVEGVVYDFMLRNSSDNVVMGDGRMLSSFIADYITTTEVENKLQALIGTAPAALDTLGEIAEKLSEDENLHQILVEGLADKVEKVAGMGLSKNDFTDVLKTKLDGLINYTHPATHSADMITETASKQFVTAEEKQKLANVGRILTGISTPPDLTENDIFLQEIQ